MASSTASTGSGIHISVFIVVLLLIIPNLLNAYTSSRSPHAARRRFPQPDTTVIARRRQDRPATIVS